MESAEVMGGLTATTLKSLARKAGIAKGVTRKGELISAFEQLLTKHLSVYLALLTQSERNFLVEAAHGNGRVDPAVFVAKHNQQCPRPGRWVAERSASLVHLIVGDDEYSKDFVIPDELIEPLQRLLPKPATPRIETVATLEPVVQFPKRNSGGSQDQRTLHVHCGESVAWPELRRVLNLVQAGKLRVQEKSRRPTSASERIIAESLTVPDFDLELPASLRDKWTLEAGAVRAHAWAVLVQQCGWARPRKDVLTLTKEGKGLLSGIDADAFRKGVGLLAFDENFDELNRVNHIRGQSGKGKRYLTSPGERREAILMSIYEWPVNQWIELKKAHRFVYASGNSFAVTEYPYHYYFGERQYGYLTEAAPLNVVYTRTFLFEALATLGVVDVAYVYPHYLWPEMSGCWGTDDLDFCSRYDGLLYVRLNALGAWCLELSEHYEPPEPESRSLFTVLPNRDLAVAGESEITVADTGMLDLFAKRHSDRVWRLDRQRILTHVENGGSFSEVRQFLEQNSSVPIPKTVSVFLDDLESKTNVFGGTQDALLLEVSDPTVAALIANDVKTRKYCYLAGERHLAVIKRNERAFRTALKKLGYVLPQ